jgi:hypothetical protein
LSQGSHWKTNFSVKTPRTRPDSWEVEIEDRWIRVSDTLAICQWQMGSCSLCVIAIDLDSILGDFSS